MEIHLDNSGISRSEYMFKKIDEKLIIKHIKKYNVTNMCCAPIVLKKILNTKFKLKKRVEVLMAGAASIS